MKKVYSLLFLLTIFTACEQDEINDTKEENSNEIQLKQYEFKDLRNSPILREVFKIDSENFKNNTRTISSLEQMNNFTLDSTIIREIKLDDYISYTIPIIRDYPTPYFFENLVVQRRGKNKIEAFLIKYVPSEKIVKNIEHNSITFKGERYITKIDYKVSKINHKENQANCYQVLEVWCSYDTDHVAGPRCYDANDGRLYEVSHTECDDSSSETGGGGGGGSSSGDDTPCTGLKANAPCEGDDDIITGPIPDDELIVDEEVMFEIKQYIKNKLGLLNTSPKYKWLNTMATTEQIVRLQNYIKGELESQESIRFGIAAIDAWMNEGEVDYQNKIVKDSTFIGTKADCVYELLKNGNSNLFRETIGEFIDNPKYKLILSIGDNQYNAPAVTDQKKLVPSGILEIRIHPSSLTLSAVELGGLILHEAIHSELFRIVDAIDPDENPNERARMLQLYLLYGNIYDPENVPSNTQHIYMTEKYVIPIQNTMWELDGKTYPKEYYNSFAWDGLRDWDASNYLDMVEDENNGQYRNIINTNSNLPCD